MAFEANALPFLRVECFLFGSGVIKIVYHTNIT